MDFLSLQSYFHSWKLQVERNSVEIDTKIFQVPNYNIKIKILAMDFWSDFRFRQKQVSAHATRWMEANFLSEHTKFNKASSYSLS